MSAPSLAARVGAIGWYHTLELPGGVVTPGWFDTRPVVPRLPWPTSLRGRRALDVGTFDGFWAFEMERRGGQVVGLDTDEIPPPDTPLIHRAALEAQAAGDRTGKGFEVLKRYFGSAAERRRVNIYDLAPEAVGGAVDVAFVGAVLLHLRDPVRALERVHATMSPGATLICFEPVDAKLSRRRHPLARYLALDTPWTWWYPNRAALVQWVATAGFRDVNVRGSSWVFDRTGNRQLLTAVHALR